MLQLTTIPTIMHQMLQLTTIPTIMHQMLQLTKAITHHHAPDASFRAQNTLRFQACHPRALVLRTEVAQGAEAPLLLPALLLHFDVCNRYLSLKLPCPFLPALLLPALCRHQSGGTIFKQGEQHACMHAVQQPQSLGTARKVSCL